MCIIVYKPKDQQMPSKQTLKMCWHSNPDGAGYMMPNDDGKIVIKKGFMTFKSFWKSLIFERNKYKGDRPIVMHFRVSTQAGVNPECTHPFPLSDKMDNLKKLSVTTQCGIAHNGIIDLTSDKWNKTITYSDTMKFITDYLSLIITTKHWYEDKKKKLLIERLADSKLAIMMDNGHVELIGEFIQDNGIYYSNSYYKIDRYAPKPVTTSAKTYIYNSYDEYLESTYGHYNGYYYETKKGDKK